MTAPVRILRIAAGGDGVGHAEDGRTVFVPRTAPGDLVRIRILEPRRRFIRARLEEIVEPGPGRTEPRCPHFRSDDCGGCQLQHLDLPAQREARSRIVGDALRRLGHLDLPDPVLIPANAEWGYRQKLTLAITAGARRIGLHRQGRPGDIFDLAHCDVTDPDLMRLWALIRSRRNLLPPEATHLVLRRERGGRLHFLVRTTGVRPWAEAERMRRELMEEGASPVIWWEPEGGAARVVAGDPDAFPAVVFEQINPVMGEAVRSYAVERLGSVSDRHLWDLYAGIGETTGRLLALGATVESVEIDRRAVELAERREAMAGGRAPSSQRPFNLRVVRHSGRVEELVERLRPPHAVITNPPRSGMDAVVVGGLASRKPERIVYVSCDPATLARDVARLGAGWRVSDCRAFDLFPQTAHVEVVLTLEPT